MVDDLGSLITVDTVDADDWSITVREESDRVFAGRGDDRISDEGDDAVDVIRSGPY